MAQEPGLFSVRRQSLAPMNNNISSIPMPASAMKRTSSVHMQQPAASFGTSHGRSQSGGRLSLAPSRPSQPVFQRSSSGTNLAEQGFGSIKRQSTSNMFSQGSASGARKSFAPGAPVFQTPAPAPVFDEPAQRRSSVFQKRSSSQGPGQKVMKQSVFQTAPQSASTATDPRRLKDASTRSQMGQELLEYLSQNNFEMESKHSLSPKCMTSPTQKDFNNMFMWLYKRIDPFYRFQKSIDQEVPLLLKQLRYPYEKSIMKSQIAAVGGNNWPTFLGLLHWLMQLAQMISGYEHGNYDDACLEAGLDPSGDRIILNFLSDGYNTWLSTDEDEDYVNQALQEHVQVMARRFDEANAHHLEQVELLEAEYKVLQDQIDELSKSGPRIQKLEEQIRIMEEDRLKFEKYNQNMDGKLEKYTNRCDLLGKSIEEIEAELEASIKEKQELQSIIDGRGMTIADIDRMSTEKERLDASLKAALARVEESKKRVAESELIASRKLDELEQSVVRFNNLGYQIGIIPSTAVNAKGQDYQIVLAVDNKPNFSSSQLGASSQTAPNRLLADSGVGYSPQTLINLDLRGTVKANILALRKEISQRRNSIIEADMNNHDLLDQVKQAMDDKQAEVEALGHRVAQAEEEFEKLRENMGTQKMASDAQIEKLQKELGRMNSNLGGEVRLLVQREMAVNLEYEQVQLRANALREELHTEIERMLDDVVKFKLHVQKSLEEYEQFIADEVERSCQEEEGLGDVEEMEVDE